MTITDLNPPSGDRILDVTSAELEALADGRRRTVLDVLQCLSPADPGELAAHVVKRRAGKPLTALTQTEVRDVRRQLHHRHLPKLERADLISWSEGRITLLRHSPFEVWEFVSTLESEAIDWDGVFAAMAEERYRTVAEAVASRASPTDRSRLARTVTERDRDQSGLPDAVDDVEARLHHVYLPKLERIGLLSYQREDATVHHGEEIDTVEQIRSSLSVDSRY